MRRPPPATNNTAAPRVGESCSRQRAETLPEDIRTEFNIVRMGKSVSEVTDNKRLRSMYCNIEANY